MYPLWKKTASKILGRDDGYSHCTEAEIESQFKESFYNYYLDACEAGDLFRDPSEDPRFEYR